MLFQPVLSENLAVVKLIVSVWLAADFEPSADLWSSCDLCAQMCIWSLAVLHLYSSSNKTWHSFPNFLLMVWMIITKGFILKTLTKFFWVNLSPPLLLFLPFPFPKMLLLQSGITQPQNFKTPDSEGNCPEVLNSTAGMKTNGFAVWKSWQQFMRKAEEHDKCAQDNS